MKKLVKKNKIPKGQLGLFATAPIWGPYVVGALGTAAAGAAAYPYIKNIVGSLDLNDVDWSKVKDFVSFNPHFTTGNQLIYPQLEALDNHLYTALGEGVPMREVVITPDAVSTDDYTQEFNPLKQLGKLGRWAVNSVKSGYGSDATPPEDKDKDKKEEKPEKEKPGKEEESETPENTDAGQEVENAQLKERINQLESRLKELLKTSKSSTWGKIGKGTAWGIGGGLGLWGTGSLLTRGLRGVGFAMQPGGTFGEGFKYTGSGMIGGVLRNLTKSKYEEYRKEHPIEDKSEENKEERDTTATSGVTPNLKSYTLEK